MRKTSLRVTAIMLALSTQGFTAALAEDDPDRLRQLVENHADMHFLGAHWNVGAVDNVSAATLGFGLRRADLEPDALLEDSLAATNSCTLETAVRSFPGGVPFPSNLADGSCETAEPWPLSYLEGLTVLLPGIDDGNIVASATETGLDIRALKQRRNAFSTDVGNTDLAIMDSGFNRRGMLQTFFAKKSAAASFEDLAGNWAITRLEIEVEPVGEIFYTVLNFAATISADGNLEATTETEFIESEFRQYPDGSPVMKRRFEATTEDDDISIPLELFPDGRLQFNTGDTGQPGRNPQILSGFIAPTADFFVLGEGVPNMLPLRMGETDLPDVNEFAAHQLMIGIKRKKSPRVKGRKYDLVGVKFHPNAEGFELVKWAEGAKLNFKRKRRGVWKINTQGIEVPLANAGFPGVQEFEQDDRIPFRYAIDDEGRITFDISKLEEVEQDIITGFASRNNKVLVFAHGLSLNDATEGEIGMWLGLCSNCD